MSLACLIGRHRARPSAVRNQGLYFSHCARCERDMVRSLGAWRAVPRGFRVVWRGTDWCGLVTANLPVPSARVAEVPGETAASRLSAIFAMAGAGLRAVAWGAADRIESWRRRALARRRPALLRLPAR